VKIRMTFIRAAAACATSALLLTACATARGPDGSAPVIATLGEDGGDIVLRPGQTLYANLYLREGTGMVWRIDRADHLAKVGYQGGMVGRGGRPLPGVVGHNEIVQQFTFQAKGRGEGDLVFRLAPARETQAEAVKVAAYRVHVR
jgi:hypothetical protein